ncbi:hypothetical protein [Lacrimispora sp.]|uniref:hypothetical protein n=1 Tax=Lacrimispora sp. TaxID=2719234 RepID=UPI0028A84BF2|nr:hypothetical protein [Lacrimispora sp.]
MRDKGKKVIILTRIISLSLLGGLAGTMSSYAKGPGEITQVSQTVPIETYKQSMVKQLGNWRQNTNGTWSFLKFNDQAVCNAWLESLTEPGAFYYLDSNGIMLVNATTPDGYQVDGNGLWRSQLSSNETSNSSSASSKSEGNSRIDELSQEFLDYVKENAGASAYGGLH